MIEETKKEKIKPLTINYDKQIEDLTDLILKSAFAITETNKRIDRLVEAVSKSKSVRGI